MPEKKLKLSRKEFQADLPDPDRVFLIHGDAEAPEGGVGIHTGIAKACYLVLLDPAPLQELCRLVGFQPPGFRINKMDPAELFIQLVRHVQSRGYGAAPVVKLIDDAASCLAETDPEVFKVNLLSAPGAFGISEDEAECWAAATWLKARLGVLDKNTSSQLTEIGSQYLFHVAASNRLPVTYPRTPQDDATQKAKEKATAWRDRALKAEKELSRLRSSRDSFERELRETKGETELLRVEVSRIQEECRQRVSAGKSAEEKYAGAVEQLKDGRVTIGRLEAELQELRARAGIASLHRTGRHSEPQGSEFSQVRQALERLQKSMDAVVARLGEFPAAASPRPPTARHSERVIAFVDVANLDGGASSYFHGKVDYDLLARFLNSRTPTGRARACENVAFICLDGRSSTNAFAQTLKSLGYRVVSRTMKVFADGNTKRNVDVQLAVYAMRQIDRLDTAVIASGDGDFACLAEFFGSCGKRVEVLSFPNLALELRHSANEVVILDQRILLPGTQREIPWDRQAPS